MTTDYPSLSSHFLGPPLCHLRNDVLSVKRNVAIFFLKKAVLFFFYFHPDCLDSSGVVLPSPSYSIILLVLLSTAFSFIPSIRSLPFHLLLLTVLYNHFRSIFCLVLFVLFIILNTFSILVYWRFHCMLRWLSRPVVCFSYSYLILLTFLASFSLITTWSL